MTTFSTMTDFYRTLDDHTKWRAVHRARTGKEGIPFEYHCVSPSSPYTMRVSILPKTFRITAGYPFDAYKLVHRGSLPKELIAQNLSREHWASPEWARIVEVLVSYILNTVSVSEVDLLNNDMKQFHGLNSREAARDVGQEIIRTFEQNHGAI